LGVICRRLWQWRFRSSSEKRAAAAGRKALNSEKLISIGLKPGANRRKASATRHVDSPHSPALPANSSAWHPPVGSPTFARSPPRSAHGRSCGEHRRGHRASRPRGAAGASAATCQRSRMNPEPGGNVLVQLGRSVRQDDPRAHRNHLRGLAPPRQGRQRPHVPLRSE